MLALGVLILFSSYAGASFSALPPITIALTSLPVDTLEKVSPASQSLGRLAAISWNNLGASGYQAVVSRLLVLPTHNEFSAQAIAPGEDSSSTTCNSIVDYGFTQAANPIETLLQSSKAHSDVGFSCTACHSAPNTIYPAIATLNNPQSSQTQGHAGSIVDCAVCHIQKPEQISWHFRGVE